MGPGMVLGGYWVVPGIAPPATHRIPYPGYTPPHRMSARPLTTGAVALTKYGRGAHIRRSTLFRPAFLSVQGYDRGL